MPARTDMVTAAAQSGVREREFRYLRPSSFQVPAALAGLRLTGTDRDVHRNHYFDAAVDGRPALRDARCSLRVRSAVDGSAQATLKIKSQRKLADGEVDVMEVEAALYGPASSPALFAQAVNTLAHPAFDAARRIAGPDATFVELLTVDCDRRNHHFTDDRGNHLVLSEDDIVYPDGSRERRIEIELKHGTEKALAKADRHLRRAYPKIKPAARGKLSEGRRRLARLLDV